jgi:hypothetical protein
VRVRVWAVHRHAIVALQSLLRGMLTTNPSRRASLLAFLNHPWLNVDGSAEDALLRAGLPRHILTGSPSGALTVPTSPTVPYPTLSLNGTGGVAVAVAT